MMDLSHFPGFPDPMRHVFDPETTPADHCYDCGESIWSLMFQRFDFEVVHFIGLDGNEDHQVKAFICATCMEKRRASSGHYRIYTRAEAITLNAELAERH